MSSIVILGHFANFKLAGDRVVRDAVLAMQSDHQSQPSAMRSFFSAQGSAHMHSSSRMRRRRRHPGRLTRFSSRSTSRVHALSDADLEAELAARRAARARERDRYAKAMRSEKLTVLESELMRLRNEISRLDHTSGVPLGGGTPPTSRWEPLGGDHRSRSPALRNNPGPRTGSLATPNVNAPPQGPPASGVPPPGLPSQPPGAPPPPPPPPPPGAPPPPPLPGGDDGDEPFDPEKQKREKAERQRRREQKRKEREAAKKPMTLADIIRAAGPDPARRLKPKGSTALDDPETATAEENEEKKAEGFGALKDSLKKVEPVKKDEAGDTKAESKEDNDDDKRTEKPNSSESKDEDSNPKPESAEEEDANGPADGEKESSESSNGVATVEKEKEDKVPAAESEQPDSVPSPASIQTAPKPEGNAKPPPKPPAVPMPPLPPTAKPNGSTDTPGDGQKSASPEDAAASAISAISALGAKLSEPKTNAPAQSPTAKSDRRLAMAERRKLRKAAANATSPTDNATETKADPDLSESAPTVEPGN